MSPSKDLSGRPTDVNVRDVAVEFTPLRLRQPLKLSTAQVSEITYAEVNVLVEDRRGRVARGSGGVLLSDAWAFPGSASHAAKDELMRALVVEVGRQVVELAGYADPFEIARLVEEALLDLSDAVAKRLGREGPIPRLAAAVCWSPIDAAIHDAWGNGAGASVYRLYTGEFLNHDLSALLGPSYRGQYPADFLTAPRKDLAVQHLVGGADPLTAADALPDSAGSDGTPRTLTEWIERDHVAWFKVKTTGTNVDWDLDRVSAVYAIAREALARLPGDRRPRLCVDANEACPDPQPVSEFLARLREVDPDAYEALVYLEQPTHRQLDAYDFTLHSIAQEKPVLVDEGLEDLASLSSIEKLGWSGVALKTCKGQSFALLTYCWARSRGLFTTLQDLTNPGLPLIQSANLAGHLALSVDAFEYNSRQYLVDHTHSHDVSYPDLFRVDDGRINLGQAGHRGLY